MLLVLTGFKSSSFGTTDEDEAKAPVDISALTGAQAKELIQDALAATSEDSEDEESDEETQDEDDGDDSEESDESPRLEFGWENPAERGILSEALAAMEITAELPDQPTTRKLCAENNQALVIQRKANGKDLDFLLYEWVD